MNDNWWRNKRSQELEVKSPSKGQFKMNEES